MPGLRPGQICLMMAASSIIISDVLCRVQLVTEHEFLHVMDLPTISLVQHEQILF
jgi:hypothetical protein